MPYPIPAHNQPLNSEPVKPRSPAKPPLAADISDDARFAEIDIPPRADRAAPAPQPIAPAADEKRVLFYEMRQIARNNSPFHAEHAKVFYQQALFMKNFEDDYTERVPFSCYFPYYQLMSYEQLRTYFTWRAQVRRAVAREKGGVIENTSVSYAFLYIYELLNNIGAASPMDGLDKLMAFWRAFRVCDAALDKYVPQWLKDYHVYYGLPDGPVTPAGFREFAKANHLQGYYPTVFGYESDGDLFNLFSGISKYDIRKSAFYGEKTARLIRDCFCFLLNRLRELCKAKGKRFEDFVFYPIADESTWTPFSKALFYHAVQQQDRRVVISENESYTCRQNHWVYKTVILNDNGGQLIGYIMKVMEAGLREALRFQYKLSVNPGRLDINELRNFGIPIEETVRTAVSEFCAAAARKPVSVDAASLGRIRREAAVTQEKLLVPEDAAADAGRVRTNGQFAPAVRPRLLENVFVNRYNNTEPPPDIPAALQVSNIWGDFRAALTQTEKDAVAAVLQARQEDIKALSDANGIMLEVLADGINRQAVDIIGDVILAFDDTELTIYDEYRENLIKAWGC
ncbi:MAG: TerB N-terminal domain-containing protein [Clostridiales bacterium]|nr:TerB N-terminal domain-containing protein [Clostridiales bacterium]